MEEKRAEYEARGIAVAAVSYDTVRVLKAFAERKHIGFPLLADPDIDLIKAFGIVNRDVPEDHPAYGFPYAGYYLLDENGLVKAKYFGEENNQRYTSANILVREFKARADSRQGRASNDHIEVTWSASNGSARPGQVVALLLEVELAEGFHVYAPGVEGGYIPIEWSVDTLAGTQSFPADFPQPRVEHLPAIDETVPVYEGAFRLMRDLRILGGRSFPEALRGKRKVVLEGRLKYQACDDEICHPPAVIPLEWTFRLKEHDLTRAPESIRRRN